MPHTWLRCGLASQDTLNLQLERGYLETLLENERVKKYLGQKHAELLG